MKLIFLLAFLFSCQQKPGGRDVDESASETNNEQVVLNDVENVLTPVNNGDVILFSLVQVAQYDQKLIGGTAADPKDWPASFTTASGNSRCTGTMIGPKTLQLAAHCVGNGRSASINHDGKTYTSVCTHSPKYRNNSTADYALCLMTESVPVAWYEVVETTQKPSIGDDIILGGMGCTQPGGGGGSNNVFRVGKAPVTRLPNGTNNDIVTQGTAALCFGDSGGSAFWEDPSGNLKVVGINSRGNIRNISYLSATFTKDATDFYKAWAQSNKAEICGITPNLANCRKGEGGDPQPQSPVPAWCKESFAFLDRCIFGTPRLSLSEPQKCQDTYAELYACQVASEQPDSL